MPESPATRSVGWVAWANVEDCVEHVSGKHRATVPRSEAQYTAPPYAARFFGGTLNARRALLSQAEELQELPALERLNAKLSGS